MEYFETEALPSPVQPPPLWLSYTNDCFSIWPIYSDFRPFLQDLNDAEPTIKFSVEYEQNESIALLETNETRNGTQFLFNIYRKPIHSTIQTITVKRQQQFTVEYVLTISHASVFI